MINMADDAGAPPPPDGDATPKEASNPEEKEQDTAVASSSPAPPKSAASGKSVVAGSKPGSAKSKPGSAKSQSSKVGSKAGSKAGSKPGSAKSGGAVSARSGTSQKTPKSSKSPKPASSRRSSKASVAQVNKAIKKKAKKPKADDSGDEGEDDEELPEGAIPLFLASKTQEIFEVRCDEDVTDDEPYKLLRKDDILKDLLTVRQSQISIPLSISLMIIQKMKFWLAMIQILNMARTSSSLLQWRPRKNSYSLMRKMTELKRKRRRLYIPMYPFHLNRGSRRARRSRLKMKLLST